MTQRENYQRDLIKAILALDPKDVWPVMPRYKPMRLPMTVIKKTHRLGCECLPCTLTRLSETKRRT